jgi:hypothetical protein
MKAHRWHLLPLHCLSVSAVWCECWIAWLKKEDWCMKLMSGIPISAGGSACDLYIYRALSSCYHIRWRKGTTKGGSCKQTPPFVRRWRGMEGILRLLAQTEERRREWGEGRSSGHLCHALLAGLNDGTKEKGGLRKSYDDKPLVLEA